MFLPKNQTLLSAMLSVDGPKSTCQSDRGQRGPSTLKMGERAMSDLATRRRAGQW